MSLCKGIAQNSCHRKDKPEPSANQSSLQLYKESYKGRYKYVLRTWKWNKIPKFIFYYLYFEFKDHISIEYL